jgi:predicted transcriptional regulator
VQAASAHNGMSKTQFMYRTFLPYMQVKEYLDILMRNGLLEHERPARIYRTTQKGLKFLEIYRQLEELKINTIGSKSLQVQQQ